MVGFYVWEHSKVNPAAVWSKTLRRGGLRLTSYVKDLTRIIQARIRTIQTYVTSLRVTQTLQSVKGLKVPSLTGRLLRGNLL